MKILIGCPIHECKDYAIHDHIQSVLNLNIPKNVQIKIMYVDNSPDAGQYMRKIYSKYQSLIMKHIDFEKGAHMGQRIAICRNVIRQKALADNFDYFFSVECDVNLPPDALVKLLSHKKDVTSGIFYEGFYPDSWNHQNELKESNAGCLGVTLISRKILEKLPFHSEGYPYDDAIFYHELYQDGFKHYVDCSIVAAHNPSHYKFGVRKLNLIHTPKKKSTEDSNNVRPHFSIIVVYNNFELLQQWTMLDIEHQSMQNIEIILVDNSRQWFKSAAKALNYAGNKANGEYLIFAHQDIKFPSYDWLKTMYQNIKTSKLPIGAVGCAGATSDGTFVGNVVRQLNSGIKSFFIETQTIDEMIIITPRNVFQSLKGFDEETFDGWHCYGCDYALSVTQMGFKAYCSNIGLYHQSTGQSVYDGGLYPAQEKLQKKWNPKVGTVFTTCGPCRLPSRLRNFKRNIPCAAPRKKLPVKSRKDKPKSDYVPKKTRFHVGKIRR